ncbi:hypothetical protein GBF35_24940 [Nonomuraea phyllanthi]|uniref:hypothetical protein n=1 Tax=Nonomuraea phyllanthi TaxID=2219224 RepID=UPI0012933E28|nr:hypothetical protein [Nonomuraea phyllanthi]QFY09458.1 hypothetical protein GBF35_24940 [Nonomuraea phyllanthi]
MEVLLERARTAYVPVIALTDEELTVLDGPEADQIVPRPWYDSQDRAAQDTACAVALRSLVARGIARPEQAGDDDDDVVLLLSDDLRDLLAARRTPRHIVMAERILADSRQTRVFYVGPAPVAVEESVDDSGLHGLAVGPIEQLAERFAQFCDPHDGAGQRQASGPRRVPLTDIARGVGQEIFAEALAITQISHHRLSASDEVEETRQTIYAPRGRVVLAVPESDGEDGVLALADLRPGELREHLLDLLRPPAG